MMGRKHSKDWLSKAPEVINRTFDVIELLVIRLTLLALVILGAYELVKGHL